MGLFAQGLFASGLFAPGLFAGDEQVPEILTIALASGIFEEFYLTPIQTSGASPKTFSILLGSLPPGLSMNASTGQISGVAAEEGTFPFTVQVENAFGTDEQALVLVILGFVAGRFIQQLQKTSLPRVESN